MTLTATTITERYKANYDRIAREHVAYARANNGANPFMEPALVETLEAATETLVRRHVTEGSAVLDAGCGPGTLLARLTKDYFCYGVDLSRDYLDYAQTLLGHEAILAQTDLGTIPHIGNHMDAVICADVLEHVLDEHAVLRELIRVLRPGGHLIVRVPCEEDLAVYVNAVHEFIHLRKFDHTTLLLLLEKIHGLTVIGQDTVEYPGWTEIHAVAVKP